MIHLGYRIEREESGCFGSGRKSGRLVCHTQAGQAVKPLQPAPVGYAFRKIKAAEGCSTQVQTDSSYGDSELWENFRRAVHKTMRVEAVTVRQKLVF